MSRDKKISSVFGGYLLLLQIVIKNDLKSQSSSISNRQAFVTLGPGKAGFNCMFFRNCENKIFHDIFSTMILK